MKKEGIREYIPSPSYGNEKYAKLLHVVADVLGIVGVFEAFFE
jgi:hypothetical protein